jgi:hypothetical protein
VAVRRTAEAATFETTIAYSVALAMLIETMLAAIDLDNQMMSHAHEIDDRPAAG